MQAMTPVLWLGQLLMGPHNSSFLQRLDVTTAYDLDTAGGNFCHKVRLDVAALKQCDVAAMSGARGLASSLLNKV